jgi:hydroxyethylthiazole kinase-like uncharacterized protein yjeF
MAALENQLFASGLPVEALMEKAALAIARRLLEKPPAAALVLVGPGHNGGDGLVVARELHLAGVSVRLWTPFERPKPLTSTHLRHCRWLGIPLLEGEPDPGDGALWIDGLFGVGQRRPIDDAIASLLTRRHLGRPGALVAIDVPTGLCSDSGRLLGRAAARAGFASSAVSTPIGSCDSRLQEMTRSVCGPTSPASGAPRSVAVPAIQSPIPDRSATAKCTFFSRRRRQRTGARCTASTSVTVSKAVASASTGMSRAGPEPSTTQSRRCGRPSMARRITALQAP